MKAKSLNPACTPAGEKDKGGAERQHNCAHQRGGAAQWHRLSLQNHQASSIQLPCLACKVMAEIS